MCVAKIKKATFDVQAWIQCFQCTCVIAPKMCEIRRWLILFHAKGCLLQIMLLIMGKGGEHIKGEAPDAHKTRLAHWSFRWQQMGISGLQNFLKNVSNKEIPQRMLCSSNSKASTSSWVGSGKSSPIVEPLLRIPFSWTSYCVLQSAAVTTCSVKESPSSHSGIAGAVLPQAALDWMVGLHSPSTLSWE